MSIDLQISECNNNIEKYKVLEGQLQSIVSYLWFSRNCCNDIKNVISNLYQVDDKESVIRNRVSNLSDKIESTYNNIVNFVIPAISSAKDSLYLSRENLYSEIQEQEDLEQ